MCRKAYSARRRETHGRLEIRRAGHMGIMTAKEYLESVEEVRPTVYIHGELAEDLYKHPLLQPSLNSMMLTYSISHNPRWQAASDLLDGEPISLWTHPYFSKEDMIRKVDLERTLGRMTGSCFQRCVGMDMISAMWATTYDVDQAKGTHYHERFKAWLKEAQRKDLPVAGAMTDVKGDRGKRPSQPGRAGRHAPHHAVGGIQELRAQAGQGQGHKGAIGPRAFSAPRLSWPPPARG
jgi:hypothetical protein